MDDLAQKNKGILYGKLATLIAWLAMLLFALQASTHMVGAGDTWVAMACGRHFINHGVDTNEPFSANSHKPGPTPEDVKTWPGWAQKITSIVGLDTVKYWHPTGWVNQNWLTHTIFYYLVHYSPFADDADWSFNMLVYWKITIYILTIICVYYTARVLGVHPALAAAFACAAMFIGRSLYDIRPAGFSNLLVAVFMLILVLATYRNYLYIWLMVPLTIFWANIHGGYIYVFIMFVPLIVLRLLITLPRRATVSLHCILTWLALFVATVKYTSHEPFTLIPPLHDKFLFLVLVFIVVSIVMARLKSINAPGFYGYHVVISLLVFFVLLSRFFSKDIVLRNLPEDLADYVMQSRITFFLAFIAAVGLGFVVTLLKNHLVVFSPAALHHHGDPDDPAAQTTSVTPVAKHHDDRMPAVIHTALAAFAAFIASILFNPFHLTNLTHTFVISISPHAEGWRNVHEWWAAFKWNNPVGTAFPFLVMLVAGVGLLGLWLFNRLVVPKQMKMVKTEQEKNERRFNILIRILGFAATATIIWTVMISFSMAKVGFAGCLLTCLFAGIIWASIFISVHFIYLIIPLSVFALQTAKPGQGYEGRYIYPFITAPIYAAVFAISAQFSKKPKYKVHNILLVTAAAAAALVLSAKIENPFKFEKPIWHIGQFFGIPRPWRPIYEANLDLPYRNMLDFLYLLSALCVIGWITWGLVRDMFMTQDTPAKNLPGQAGRKTQDTVETGREYRLPRIDLALITIAALTAYMAVRSRRFITIAGYASCPVMAMFSQQILSGAGAAWNYYKRGRLEVPRMPRGVQYFVTGAAVVLVGVLGIFWGHKFKVVYLDAWPSETKLTSIFIRMTASHAKPFYAMEFVRMNKIAGNMFNYWTEGGFIAWGQEPDPNTGRTPLRLFMDGRAQAAYNYDAYLRWAQISSGGPVIQIASYRNQTLTAEDYKESGKWIDGQLKKSNVWVVLMPSNQFDQPFVRGLERCENWQIVFMNDKQRLYVDVSDPRGKKLFNGIMDGTTLYPDEYSRNVALAHTILLFERSPERVAYGADCALKAIEECPSRIPAQLIQFYYQQYPALRTGINAFWKEYLDDFLANEAKYINSDGYLNRTTLAITAIAYVMPFAQQAKQEEVVKLYQQKEKELRGVLYSISDKKW